MDKLRSRFTSRVLYNRGMSMAFPKIQTVGLAGFLVTFAPHLDDAANCAALAYRAAVDAARYNWISESATSLVSVFLSADLARIDHTAARADLERLLEQRDWLAAELPIGRRFWRIPTTFGGELAPGLSDAAQAAHIGESDAIRELCARTLRVLTIGFAPGQPYLGTLDAHWDIPRLTGLTPNVPQGAIVAAVRQICLFSNDTPTGWHHVGQTAFKTFMPDAQTPVPFRPGDEVQFEPVSHTDLLELRAHGVSGAQMSEIE